MIESTEHKVKYEIELFKVFAIFVIALGTGLVSLFLNSALLINFKITLLFTFGLILFIVFIFVWIYFLVRIIKRIKNL